MGLFTKKEKAVVAPKAEKAPKVAKVKKADKKTASTAVTVATPSVASALSSALDTNRIILRPRITEKSTLKADTENVFVFEIAQTANKTTVKQAISKIYNVIPVKVSIARNPSKRVFLRGKAGVVGGVKKAYVYLKKGDKIEIV